MRPQSVLHGLLIAVGLLAMGGYVGEKLGFADLGKAMKGIGAATTASPLPIVFSDVRGFETFAADFAVTVRLKNGAERRIELTPAVYARLGGPYNRRNIYGAAISYGPRLPEDTWRSILTYGICRNGPLAETLALDGEVATAAIAIAAKTRGRDDKFLLTIECNI